MSHRRDYRRGKDGRAEDRFAERRRRYRPLLRALGLEEAFEGLPRPFQELFWSIKYPDPAFRFAPEIPSRVRREMEKAVADAVVKLEVGAEGAAAAVDVRARDVIT